MRALLRWLGRIVLVLTLVVVIALAGFRWQASRREQHLAAELAPKTGRFVRALDVDMFVQEAGPATGPAVLFVHGTGAWSETWRDTLTALGDAGYRAIALDLPPFGYSGRPVSGSYDKQTQGKRIVGAIEALKFERVVLVGHSFGGGPTVEAALLAPERIRALVLVDVALSLSDGKAAPGASPILKGVLGLRPMRDSLVATFLTNPQFTKRLLQSFVDNPAAATEPRVRIYQQPLEVAGTTVAVGQWLPELLAPAPGAPSTEPSSYKALTMPALVLWGGKDTITPLDQGHRIAGALPNAKLSVIDGVGHIPQIEGTSQFNERLLEFLAGQKPIVR